MGIIARLLGLEPAPTTNTIQLETAPELSRSRANMPPDGRTKQFTIRKALNGHVVEVFSHKYNQNGPDEFRNEVFVVPEGESLVDAISVMLVLTEK